MINRFFYIVTIPIVLVLTFVGMILDMIVGIPIGCIYWVIKGEQAPQEVFFWATEGLHKIHVKIFGYDD